MQNTKIITKEAKKAAVYYIANQEVSREDAKNKYKNLLKKKEKKRKYQRERYHMNTDLMKN